MAAEIKIRRSSVTGHWVVGHLAHRQGFRRWPDAMEHAQEIAVRLRKSYADLMEADWVLRWHYGPTVNDSDPGKMWCYHCAGEVMWIEGGYICGGCDRSLDDAR